MPTPRPLSTIERDITQAMADLRYMRRRAQHTPTADAEADVQAAEDYLDRLLDERLRATEVPA